MIKIDNTDKSILEYLQQDAKMNIKEVAAKVGLTVTPTYERIKRLEKTGIIKSYVAVLDKQKINRGHEVFCHVKLMSHSKGIIQSFENEILKIDDIVECYHVTGNSDYMLKILVSDIKDYQEFIRNKLSIIEDVSNVESVFVMTNVKSNSIIRF